MAQPQNPQPAQTKTVYALKPAFTEPSWPSVSLDTESVILDLLIPLLRPIGQYRRTHAVPFRHKSKKDKSRHPAPTKVTDCARMTTGRPEICDHLVIGFNSTMRRLEMLSGITHNHIEQERLVDTNPKSISSLSAILVCRDTLPAVMKAPLPLLCSMASAKHPQNPALRIVSLSGTGMSKVAQALDQPRVGLLGISTDVPELKPFEALICSSIEAINVPWIRESADARYLPVQVHTRETIPHSKLKSGKRKRNATKAS